MQDMSPDMEDLMRKASEAYPLTETEDRWNEIASKVNAPTPKPELKKDSGYKKYVASLLLLVLFLFLGLFFFDKTGVNRLSERDSVRTDETNENINTPKKSSTENQKPFTNTSKKEVQKKIVENDLPASVKENKFHLTKEKTTAHKNLNQEKLNADKEIANKPFPVSNNDSPATLKKQNIPIDKLVLSSLYPEFSLRSKTFSFNWDNSVLSSQKKKGGVYNKGFYYGVTAGPGFNSIKNQEFKKAGWNIGLVGGYYFGKKFSVETGVLFSQKHYTTMGDHFSMKEIGATMPSAMKIMAVDGYSKMIEVPVLFRYDFFQNSKRSYFSSAGFSSYILTNENNQYHTSMNGTEQMMYGTYKNNKRYFAASIDLGVGYVQKIGNKNHIRLQPYVQIPLKGVGVGDLQIMGAGLRVAITHKAH